MEVAMGRGELGRLEAQLRVVEGLIDEGDGALGACAARVSAWSVGEQVDHMLKVLDAALARLEGGADPVPGGINLVGRICLGLGRLPRGVGKSPARLRAEQRQATELAATLSVVRERCARLGGRDELWRDRRALVRHPYFGALDARRTLRFLTVHTDHHLRIVADIRRATAA
jgi:hypothetical protein